MFCLPLRAESETPAEERAFKSEILRTIEKHYFQKIEISELEKKSLPEIFKSLDKDSSLLSDQKRDLDSVRGFTQIRTVHRLEGMDHQTGGIRISCFAKSTTREFLRIYDALKKSGAKRWVLDLRQNPGGDLKSCFTFLKCFLPRNAVIANVETRNGRTVTRSDNGSPHDLTPLTVWVDSETASCAELAANALERVLHAKIVGGQTEGKHTVQQIFPVGKSRMVLTIGRWSSDEKP